MTPQRVQRKRTKGWRMPPDTVSVTRPGKWGNPFALPLIIDVRSFPAQQDLALIQCDLPLILALYRAHIVGTFDLDTIRAELGGKNLACYCPAGQPCHADVLLDLANGGTP